MNDPVVKTNEGLFRENNGIAQQFRPNLLRMYEWVNLEEKLPDGTTTTLEAEGFHKVGSVFMFSPPPTMLGENMPLISESTGGFTRATATTQQVTDIHAAVDAFKDWEPVDAQQRRFKTMVDKLEADARREEDEHCFLAGRVFEH